MFCTRCGSPNDEAAEYCRNCAEPLAKPGRGTAPFRDPTPTAGSRPRGEDPYPGYQAALPPEYQPYQPYQSPPAAYAAAVAGEPERARADGHDPEPRLDRPSPAARC